MPITRLTVLMPFRNLEELSGSRPPGDAEEILSAWSALWHPALVATAGSMPRWSSAETPPEEPAEHLILVPPCAEGRVPYDWPEQARRAGARLVRYIPRRDEMVAAALAQLDPPPEPVDPEWVRDFLALGFCHFAIESITQQMRYMSNLDEASFERELVAGAKAVCGGDLETARTHLQAALDLIHTAREYFYPTQAHLLDLTLVASTTLGASLRTELAGGRPTNLLVSGRVLEEMAAREPSSVEAVCHALDAGTAALVGGEYEEIELPLLPPEAIRHAIEHGLKVYEQHLGHRPLVFGRRRFGMTPVLPQILQQLGFTGVLHPTLDDGRYPTGSQSRVRWQGIDSTYLETIARVPSDVARAEAFLRLPQQLSGSMNMDYASTVILAHWPGRSSPWYQDLMRIAGQTTVMGTFATVGEYFEQTGMSAQDSGFKPDEYRSPYLRQAVEAKQADPISRWTRYFARRAQAEAAETLAALAGLVAGRLPEGEAGDLPGEVDATLLSSQAQASETPAEQPAADPLDQRLRDGLDRAIDGFARAVGRASTGPVGVLVANPGSAARRVCVDLPDAKPPGEPSGKTVAIEVPAMGFAWVAASGEEAQPQAAPAQPARRGWSLFSRPAPQTPPMAELISEDEAPGQSKASRATASSGEAKQGAALRNELFNLYIDARTGAIRGIFDQKSRGPRAAQQLAMRLPHASGEGEDAYSTMEAQEIRVISPGPVRGEVFVRGRLLDRQGEPVADFRQTTRVVQGSRVIELDIELEPVQQPTSDPWNCYFASRLAWADETAAIYRSMNLASLPTSMTQLESPHFVDVRLDKTRTTLLTGGLPYHRRIGLKRLDTLLIVHGETARRFRLAVGLDLPNPMAAAIDFLAPPTLRHDVPRPPSPSGWLFHLDARGVTATHWEPVVEADRITGFRVRLLETEGRQVALGLRCFRAPQSACKLAWGDQQPTDLSITDDRIDMGLGPHEWAEVEARWG